MINFLVLYILVYAIFLDVWIVENWKYFFEIWWIIHVQIFSLKHIAYFLNLYIYIYLWDLYCIVLTDCAWKCLHASVYGSHSVKFSSCVSSTYFLLGLCLFSFPHLLNFPQNVFFFFFFSLRGRKLYLKFMLFIGGFVVVHRGSCLYSLFSLYWVVFINSWHK